MSAETRAEIRRIVGEHVRLSVDVARLDDDSDLFAAGMTSHASVNLMLALEDAFEIEFPDSMLRRDVFDSVDSLAAAIDTLRADEPSSEHAGRA